MGQYQHLAYRTITMLRGGLISMLTRKTTDLSVRDVDPAASLTLMSADIERIVQGWQTMHEMWANLVEIAVAIVLLEAQLGISCLIPVAVAVGIFLYPTVIHKGANTDQLLWLLPSLSWELSFLDRRYGSMQLNGGSQPQRRCLDL